MFANAIRLKAYKSVFTIFGNGVSNKAATRGAA
jgi:hypothetical protein